MDSPEVWRWIWLILAVVLAIGEITTMGFFLLPVAAGAAIAAGLAFLGVSVAIQWLTFVVASTAFFMVLRPIAKRLDENEPTDGIGAKRLIGETATVLETIPGRSDLGLVRVHREEWRAESGDGAPIEEGAQVRIVEVTGTRLVVFPADTIADQPDPSLGSDTGT